MIAEPGIHLRSPIGLLIWMRNEEKTASYKLGSRLKTPIYPIWLIVASEQSGVLFSDDRDLLRDYRSEIRWEKKIFQMNTLTIKSYCLSTSTGSSYTITQVRKTN